MELTVTQKDFLEANHNAVCTTFRRNGAAQLSIVTSGLYGGAAAFTTTADRAKHRNLARDPRCTLLVSHADWRPFLVLEGNATVLSQDNTPAEELRVAFREVFRAASGREHPKLGRVRPRHGGRPPGHRHRLAGARLRHGGVGIRRRPLPR